MKSADRAPCVIVDPGDPAPDHRDTPSSPHGLKPRPPIVHE